MIKVIIEMEITSPLKKSFETIVEFCSLWDAVVLIGGTHKNFVKISFPLKYFKKIIGSNPKIGQYKVPRDMDKFVRSLEVKKIIAK